MTDIHLILLETPRLTAKVAMPEDSDFLQLLNGNPDVVHFTGEHPWSMHDTIDYVASNEDYERYGWSRYIISLKDPNMPIGLCGFRKYPDREDIFLSYRFLPEYWGNGYASEICSALIDHGFRKNQFSSIFAHVHPGNMASVRVAEKLGMKKVNAFEWGGEEWWEMRIDRR